jgi:cyclopropane fatty-acyl-phospholipid synthase-like methyltransferase
MADIKQAVHDQFSKTAANYRTSTVHAAGEDLAAIARMVAQDNAPVVLDAGCGAGHTAINVAPHSAQVIAFDLSAQMLDQVQRLVAERGLSNVQMSKIYRLMTRRLILSPRATALITGRIPAWH